MTDQEAGTLPDTVATIGVFDGVHLGHQALLHRVVERSADMGALSCCVTFSPHPEDVLRPDLEIRHLSPLEDRLEAIRDAGISRVELMEFTRELSLLSPEDFIAMLLSRFRLRELWVGADFALGKDRAGGHDRLAAIGRDRGFTVHSFPPVELAGQVVSSSRIRRVPGRGQRGGCRPPAGAPLPPQGHREGGATPRPDPGVPHGEPGLPGAAGAARRWGVRRLGAHPYRREAPSRREHRAAAHLRAGRGRGWWRCTCWISRATSTTGTWRWTSWSGSGARSGSTGPLPLSSE